MFTNSYLYHDAKIYQIALIVLLVYLLGNVCKQENCLEFIQKSVITYQNVFPTRCSRILTFALMGIDAHLEKSIEEGALDVDHLWLANYLKAKPAGNGVAEITAFFRIVRRIENINQEFIDRNMHRYQLDSSGRATHLVQQVVYGADFIVSLKKDIDLNAETTNRAIERLTLASRTFFDNAIKSNWIAIDPPAQLANVSCFIITNLQDGQAVHVKLRQAAECLRDATKCIEDAKWRPVEIVLFHIPSQLETRLQTETMKWKKRDLFLTMNWILTKSHTLSNHPLLDQIRCFKNILDHFIVLANSFLVKTEQFYSQHVAMSTAPSVVLGELELNHNLLNSAGNWLAQFGKEVYSLHPILNGINLAVIEVDLAKVQISPFPANADLVKMFVLKVGYKEDQVLNNLQKFTAGYSSFPCKRPFFLVASAGAQRLKDVATKLARFANEARSNPNGCYVIGLVPIDSRLNDGAVEVFLPPTS